LLNRLIQVKAYFTINPIAHKHGYYILTVDKSVLDYYSKCKRLHLTCKNIADSNTQTNKLAHHI